MAMPRLPQSQPHHQPPSPSSSLLSNLEITIISGKHLKNVNWKNGDLKPYAIFWVDPDHKLTTKSDDSGNTKPVWNQRFVLPITSPISDVFFSLEIFHSKTSETPKPFVGSLQVRLASLPEPDNPNLIRVFDLIRPSGRPQGKIRLKLAVKEQPLTHHPLPPQPNFGMLDYQNTPHVTYYYSSAPPYTPSRSASPAPPGPPPQSRGYPYPAGSVVNYPGYYPTSGARSYGAGAPSAPVDYTPYEQRTRVGGGGGSGFGSGFAVGAVAGALGGIALDEGLKYEEERVAERVEENYLGTPKGDYSDYRADF
ncbi:unnamed protein product [Amaranthus hypochondriacus]